MTFDYFFSLFYLTLKAPITTAADDKYGDNFPNFWKNKVWYFMRIVCQQTILMKRRALFVFLFFEKAAKFAIVVCCKLYVALYELTFCLLLLSADYLCKI